VVNPNPQLLRQHSIEIRVRYQETDAQARVHHANYLNYFELGRVEMLRASGIRYRDLETQGYLLVVAEISIRYYLPAEYDDLLRLDTTVVRSKGVRVEHQYQLFRNDELLADGRSVVACISKEGKILRLPEWLRI
jgi:acyl-CoA thioester hydrolase